MRSNHELRNGLHSLCRKVREDVRSRRGDGNLSNGKSYALEIGSFRGESTNIISQYFDHVYAVDPHIPYPGDRAGTKYQLTEAKKKMEELVRVNKKITHFPVTSEWARFNVEEIQRVGKFDLVYIDGAHDYENASRDISLWADTTVWLGGHDYSVRFPGVVKAVDEYVAEYNKQFEGQKILTTITRYKDRSWLFEVIRKEK